MEAAWGAPLPLSAQGLGGEQWDSFPHCGCGPLQGGEEGGRGVGVFKGLTTLSKRLPLGARAQVPPTTHHTEYF